MTPQTYSHYGRRVVESFEFGNFGNGIMRQKISVSPGHEFTRYASLKGADDHQTVTRMRREVRDVVYLLCFGYHGEASTPNYKAASA